MANPSTRLNLISYKLPITWVDSKAGRVRFLIFVDAETKKRVFQYMLRDNRTEGKDYLFSLDGLLKKAQSMMKTSGMKIVLKGALVYRSGDRSWITADSETKVALISDQNQVLFNENVTGTGEIKEGPKVEENPEAQKQSGEIDNEKENKDGLQQNENKKEIFNVYVTNPMQDWDVSKFDKEGSPTAVKKLKFKRADAKDGVLNHNVHIDKRIGGDLLELFRTFDSNLSKGLDSLKPGQTLLIKNVTYGWWRFPGANPNRDWIFPTENTTVVPITIKPSSTKPAPPVKKVPAMMESLDIVERILLQSRLK